MRSIYRSRWPYCLGIPLLSAVIAVLILLCPPFIFLYGIVNKKDVVAVIIICISCTQINNTTNVKGHFQLSMRLSIHSTMVIHFIHDNFLPWKCLFKNICLFPVEANNPCPQPENKLHQNSNTILSALFFRATASTLHMSGAVYPPCGSKRETGSRKLILNDTGN